MKRPRKKAERSRGVQAPAAGGIREQALAVVQNERKPVSLKTVMQKLRAGTETRSAVKKALRRLTQEGLIKRERNLYAVSFNKSTVTGRVQLKESFGFIIVKDGGDVFLGRRETENLLGGDIVEAWVKQGREGKEEGEVKRIVSRTSAPVLCRIRKPGRSVIAVPVGRSSPHITVDPDTDVSDGDTVLVRLADQAEGAARLKASFVLKMQGAEDLKFLRNYFLDRNDIRQEFPHEVLVEAEEAGRLHAEGKARRVDLRQETVFTIDPADAKDFDDAVSVSKKEGVYSLGVHIADVSHYVREGSAVDAEAARRGVSVYLSGTPAEKVGKGGPAGEVIPMLPETLSNRACSLVEGEDRNTFSVFMEIGAEGEVLSYKIAESLIRSAKRFTYEQVEELLRSGGSSGNDKIDRSLRIMDELRVILSEKMREGGAVDFDLGEPVFEYGPGGEVSSITRKFSLAAHKLIEHFMVHANICAADFILKHYKNGMYRVHPPPASKDVDEFNAFMSSVGENFRIKRPVNREFQKAAERAAGSPLKYLIEKKLLRSMQLARYSEKNTGHFGLALEKYTHFTSPIRRYADLVVHRLIKNALGVMAMADAGRTYLKQAAETVSDCEERAESAEMDTFRLYALDFLKRTAMGMPMEAMITRATRNGMFAELLEYPMEGFINYENMDDDYYVFDQFGGRAAGRRTGKIYRNGDKISVIIVKIGLESLKMELAPES